MKVSKPVLIFGIAVLLIAGYIHFFTGKKKAPPPSAPPAAAAGQTKPSQTTAAVQPPKAPSEPGIKGGQSDAVSPAEKPQFDKVKTQWTRNPFVLPQFRETKKKETGTAVRLSAIFEKGNDRVAIIDREVVRRGDMVGDERVLEIGSNKVVLVRNGTKRTLYLANIEDTVREEEPKTKATEKGR